MHWRLPRNEMASRIAIIMSVLLMVSASIIIGRKVLDHRRKESYAAKYVAVLDLLKDYVKENGEPAKSGDELSRWASIRRKSVPTDVVITLRSFDAGESKFFYSARIGGRVFDPLIIRVRPEDIRRR